MLTLDIFSLEDWLKSRKITGNRQFGGGSMNNPGLGKSTCFGMNCKMLLRCANRPWHWRTRKYSSLIRHKADIRLKFMVHNLFKLQSEDIECPFRSDRRRFSPKSPLISEKHVSYYLYVFIPHHIYKLYLLQFTHQRHGSGHGSLGS